MFVRMGMPVFCWQHWPRAGAGKIRRQSRCYSMLRCTRLSLEISCKKGTNIDATKPVNCNSSRNCRLSRSSYPCSMTIYAREDTRIFWPLTHFLFLATHSLFLATHSLLLATTSLPVFLCGMERCRQKSYSAALPSMHMLLFKLLKG